MAPKSDVRAWMKFYPADWLASVSASGLSLEEQGAYLRLLCTAWEHGSIPADPKRLAAIVGVSRQEFDGLWEALRQKWVECADDAGRLTNRKQEAVRKEQHAARDRKRRQRDRDRDTDRDADVTQTVKTAGDSGLRAQGSGTQETQGSEKGASAPAPRRRRDGKAEIRKAVEGYEAEIAAPVRVDLLEAMEAYRARRVKRRAVVWDADQWLGVLREGGQDQGCLVKAFADAARFGWLSVHPKGRRMSPSKAERSAEVIDGLRDRLAGRQGA